MKNCLEFTDNKLTAFITTLGVFTVLDIFKKFEVMTNIIMLDKSYLKTDDLTRVMYGATRSAEGYLKLKAQSDLIQLLINIICNPGSPEEGVKINTALKTLCRKVDGNANRFYALLSEGLHRRMLFQKLSQIYGPLSEEIKINKELLIMLINNKLISLDHLNQLSYGVDGNQQACRIADYIIHNVNHYRRVKNFLFIIQEWTRDTNLVEDLEDIVFNIEMYQCKKLEDKIKEDMNNILCEIY